MKDYCEKARLLSERLMQAERSLHKDKNLTAVPSLEELSRASNVNRSRIRGFRGKESIFKRPAPPSPEKHSKNLVIADHHKNPKKWTRYSLADVSSDDISDDGNHLAALACLKDLRRYKRMESQKMEQNKRQSYEKMEVDEAEECSSGNKSAFVFKKPEKKEELKVEKSRFVDGRLEMPEYVIGVKCAGKTNKVKKSVERDDVDKTKELKLSHLDYVDEDE